MQRRVKTIGYLYQYGMLGSTVVIGLEWETKLRGRSILLSVLAAQDQTSNTMDMSTMYLCPNHNTIQVAFIN